MPVPLAAVKPVDETTATVLTAWKTFAAVVNDDVAQVPTQVIVEKVVPLPMDA